MSATGAEPVRWAFIGAGRHTRLWLAPALLHASGARALGVWSRDPGHAADFAASFGVARAYASLDAALTDPDVEAVLVSTPNSQHAAHSLAALQAGKHVLVEKPMATSVDDAIAMVRCARAVDRQLGVGFHLRHNQVIAAGRRRIGEGAIGDVQYVTTQFNLVSSPPPRLNIAHAAWKRDADQMGGAGALMGFGVHLVDLVRYLTAQEVVGVSAVAAGMTPDSPLESFAQVHVELDGGARAHLMYGGSFPLSRNDAVAYGSAGRLLLEGAIDVASGGALHLAVPDGTPPGVRIETWRPVVPDHYQLEIETFSRAIRDGCSFTADGVDGLRVVEVACAIIASQREGGSSVVVRHTQP